MDEEYPSKEKAFRSRNRTEYLDKGYNIYSKGDELKRRDFKSQYPVEISAPDDDYDESYAYEHKTEKYSRSPRDSGDITSRRKEKLIAEPTFTRQHAPERYSSDTRRESKYEQYYAKDNYEDYHQRQSLANARQYRQEEYAIESVTSMVDDDTSFSALVTNVDPNLGLIAPLPYLDSSQRLNILREIKSTHNYSDFSTVSQLQTEDSPNIVLLGGINPPQAKDYVLGAAMFVYNVQKDRWFFGGTMPEPRNYHTAAYLNGKIYVIGGYNPLLINHGEMIATQSTFQMSVRSKRWRKRADMHDSRACHGMCIINDKILVMGGRDASGKLLSTVEIYYPKRDQWVFLKSMPKALMGLSCTVLDGCVFAIGGIGNEGHSSQYAVSNHTYAFDFEKQMWHIAPSLPEPRAFASAATLKREIWLWCGGKDALSEDNCLLSTNTVLVYNPDVTKWEKRTSIGTLKHAAAITKFGRRIYILGGLSNASGTKEVLSENDYYNREADKYMEGASLPRPLTGLAAVVLPIDYIATSDPKWNAEKINKDVLNKAATKIQSLYRGYRTRSIMSNQMFQVYTSSSNAYQRNGFVTNTSVKAPYENWKTYQRVEIEDWPPVPDPQISNSDVNLRLGTLPRGYTITSINNRTKVKRYALLPPHADPNLSMIGHLCNVSDRTKKLVGLRKVEQLPQFAKELVTAPKLQDDCLPVILLMGGLDPKNPTNLSYGKLILRYHPLKDRFEYFGALPEPRNYHAAVYYNKYIYVSGGCDPNKRNSGEMVATNTMYCLNIDSSGWEEKAEMHCNRAFHNFVVALGKIFAVGGRDNNGRLVASIEAYDIEDDKWSLLRPMTHPRMGMACAVIDDHIWCMGGLGISEDSDTVSYPVLSTVVSYDIGKDLWISRPPLRCPRTFGSSLVVKNSMWLVGGASKDHSSEDLVSMASADKYYPAEEQWVRRTLISNPRHCGAVVAVDSNIYIFGGISSQVWSPLARNEMIGVDDLSLHVTESLPMPLTGISAVAIPPVLPSLTADSLAILLHTKLTYH